MNPSMKSTVLALLGAGALALPVSASTIPWTGPGSCDWDNPDNWKPARVPAAMNLPPVRSITGKVDEHVIARGGGGHHHRRRNLSTGHQRSGQHRGDVARGGAQHFP